MNGTKEKNLIYQAERKCRLFINDDSEIDKKKFSQLRHFGLGDCQGMQEDPLSKVYSVDSKCDSLMRFSNRENLSIGLLHRLPSRFTRSTRSTRLTNIQRHCYPDIDRHWYKFGNMSMERSMEQYHPTNSDSLPSAVTPKKLWWCNGFACMVGILWKNFHETSR